MLKKPEYSMGWIDSSIHNFLADMVEPPASMTHALITCLDSCFDLPSLVRKSPALQTVGLRGELIGTALMVSTRQLLAAEQRQRIFFGFDEVWFFPQAQVKPKPKIVCLVGPTKPTQELQESWVKWLRTNNCSLGLGDGTGLNFVAKLKGMAKYIVNECVDAADGQRLA